MKIYVASSWRNEQQQGVVARLASHGHEVYDFKRPRPGDDGFHWSEVDGGWQSWTPAQFIAALDHPIAAKGFASDYDAMKWADACVLVLPCGRSAHLEAGWFVGRGRPCFILLGEGRNEPELMYAMATRIVVSLDDLVEAIAEWNSPKG